MFCTKCGKELKDEWGVCPYCGAKAYGDKTKKVDDFLIKRKSEKQDENSANFDKEEKSEQESGTLNKISFFKFVILSVLTFGIYGLYTYYQFIKITDTLCEGDEDSSPSLAAVIVVGAFTLGIYYFYWVYKQAQRLQNIAPKYNCEVKENGGNILVWNAFGSFILIGPLIAWYKMFKNMNMLVENYNTGNINSQFIISPQVPTKKGEFIGILAGFYGINILFYILMMVLIKFLFVIDDDMFDNSSAYVTDAYTEENEIYGNNNEQTLGDDIYSSDNVVRGSVSSNSNNELFIGQTDKYYHAGTSEEWTTLYFTQVSNDSDTYMVIIQSWDGTSRVYNGMLQDDSTFRGYEGGSYEILCQWTDPYTIEVAYYIDTNYVNSDTFYDKEYWGFS